MKRWAFAAALSALAGCTAYQPMGATGGFKETQLSDTTFQVRVQGNGYTSRERVSQYLLRRCAELTLEHGKRYFTMRDGDSQTAVSAGAGMAFSFPSGQVLVTLLDSKEDAFDAPMIIDQTEEVSGWRLSPAAAATLADLGIKRREKGAR